MTDQQLNALLKELTLEEKISQLLQLAAPFFEGSGSEGQITGPMASMGINDDIVKNTGSVLGLSGAIETIGVQEAHMKKNRLGIPLLVMADIIHGYKTIFPVPLAIACSWDLEAAEQSAAIAAAEASAAGVHVTFSPMVDLVRDPRWGRVMETTGEDPYLNGEFARAFVRGYQGKDLKNDLTRLAACVKHFAAYGAGEGGRDYNTVDMSERQLREYYLPAYKAALDEGAELVMTAFNTVDGIPAAGNKRLMRDLLRKEWGFDGVVISDWGAVKEMIPHGVAADEAEAACKSLLAGVDIEMMTTCYEDHLKQLVERGEVDEALIDEAVLRILELKQKLGLFENPYRGANVDREREIVMSAEHRQAARDLAVKSCVLLKNESVLPLKKEQNIALIGPFAQNGDILGPWSWLGSKADAVQLFDGLKSKTSRIVTTQGSDIESMTEEQLEEAVKAAREADVIVLALGEHSDMSGEAGSRSNIRLPDAQLELTAKLKSLGKPMVAVLFNGRPLDLHGVYDVADAVLEAWYPGTEGGAAIADLLYGDSQPSGRLTMSFPFSVGQVPVYYNNFNTGRPQGAPDAQVRYVSQYLDIPNVPLYPFGYGLSYTTFAYSDASISSDKMAFDQTLKVTVKVENTGDIAGEEVVQLYVRDLAGEVVRPLKELKGFRKIKLQPGEAQEVAFILTEEQLRYHHSDLSYTSDAGEFAVFVGPNSRDVLQALSFRLTK
ncbi:glycoside hydrolase family 3 N-terminal domain-containing protein [Paenibacillus chondroitinus]|uniref:Glycoside hydrolase family 3 N-terminal domain-containing protein n=1 Tax=Paenibacillus chondroitinus TaxID=59842 RepID=A0ABU6D913_9BACL|nr:MULTISPECIES: glycoside hydrolase family 3 N-terminal domain-containing protein [Paenibacillus]MCY9661707.1 glycoside hydrolase family 3 C-terminal domain-containing protein [Paenibacillus anseongense]MEB4793792.1 glycoside hydrolase family 3 N-terminal domain-containing protein [Paenibacillus chondroitinus]